MVWERAWLGLRQQPCTASRGLIPALQASCARSATRAAGDRSVSAALLPRACKAAPCAGAADPAVCRPSAGTLQVCSFTLMLKKDWDSLHCHSFPSHKIILCKPASVPDSSWAWLQHPVLPHSNAPRWATPSPGHAPAGLAPAPPWGCLGPARVSRGPWPQVAAAWHGLAVPCEPGSTHLAGSLRHWQELARGSFPAAGRAAKGAEGDFSTGHPRQGSTAAPEERLHLKPPTSPVNDTRVPSLILSLTNDASSSERAAFSQLPGQGELSG